MPVNVNTATVEELKQIPGVGDKTADLIIQFRRIYGVVRKEALVLALRGNISQDILDNIDFSVPRQPDPFDIDIESLPPVPKTNSWEPLLSFNQQQNAARKLQSSKVQESQARSRSPEGHKVRMYYDSSRSRSKSPVATKDGKKSFSAKLDSLASKSQALLKSYQEQPITKSDGLESGRSRSPVAHKSSQSGMKTDYYTPNPRKRSSSRETKDDLMELYEQLS